MKSQEYLNSVKAEQERRNNAVRLAKIAYLEDQLALETDDLKREKLHSALYQLRFVAV